MSTIILHNRHLRQEKTVILPTGKVTADTVEHNPTIALLDAVQVLELFTQERINQVDIDQEPASILDVIMKFEANVPRGAEITVSQVPEIPKIFSMRNSIVHKGFEPTADEVLKAIKIIKNCINDISNKNYTDIFKKALVASGKFYRGTDISLV